MPSEDHDSGVDQCPTCGAGKHFLVPVWESEVEHRLDMEPDYIGCTECHTMKPTGSESLAQ